MSDLSTRHDTAGALTIGAYEAKTRFSELIARAEKGESFIVTKNGRQVARIEPPQAAERQRGRQAVGALRRLREMQGPPVSETEAQRNYEEMKRELNAEEDERDERWISSSTPR